MRGASRISHSQRPEGVPSDAKGEAALRRWYAERMLATLHEDVEQIAQLERLEHRLLVFVQMVREWCQVPTYD